jgi:ketosteroid isomerase-like protein
MIILNPVRGGPDGDPDTGARDHGGGSVSFDKEYMDAWNTLDEDTFVEMFAPDGVYSDATMAVSYKGHDEIRRMHQATMAFYKSPEFNHVSGMSNDRQYAVEWVSVTTIDGKEWTTRVVSIGDLDENGKITENRDYWNPATVPTSGYDMSVEKAAFEERAAGA